MNSQIAWLFSAECTEVSPSLITEQGQEKGMAFPGHVTPFPEMPTLLLQQRGVFSWSPPGQPLLNDPAYHGPGRSALYDHFHSIFLLKHGFPAAGPVSSV